MLGEGHNFRQLRDAIVARSESQTWEIARLEWGLSYIFEADEPETCLCGHHPIVEICVLTNRRNGSTAEVGNVCVKRFMGIRSDKIFSCVKRLRKDLDKAPNSETIELLFEHRLISDWERRFAHNTFRKRNLSAKQMLKRHEINNKILSNIVRVRI
jgi:hypothetical protein